MRAGDNVHEILGSFVGQKRGCGKKEAVVARVGREREVGEAERKVFPLFPRKHITVCTVVLSVVQDRHGYARDMNKPPAAAVAVARSIPTPARPRGGNCLITISSFSRTKSSRARRRGAETSKPR